MKKLFFILLTPFLLSRVSAQEKYFGPNLKKGIKSEIKREFEYEQKFGEWKEIPGKEKIHYYQEKSLKRVLKESL